MTTLFYKPVPSTLLFRLVGKRQRNVVYSERVRFRNKLVYLHVYQVTARMLNLLPRMGDHAAMELGVFPDGNKFVKLYGKSVPLAELQATLRALPYVVCLSVEKGKNPDTLQPKLLLAASLAFASMDDYGAVRLKTIKWYDDHRAAKDAQRTRLYAWETAFLSPHTRADKGWRRTSETKLRAIAEDVIERYAIPQDRVHVTMTPARSASRLGVCQTFRDDASSPTPTFVVVNIHDSTPDTMIHELAHLVVNFRYGRRDKIAGHGREFCGVYARLLTEYGPFTDEAAIVASMREAKLKVLPVGAQSSEARPLRPPAVGQ